MRLRIQPARHTGIVRRAHAPQPYSALARTSLKDLPRYTNSPNITIPNPSLLARTIPQTRHVRTYTTTTSTPPTPTADALIEELQSLYEIAKDEFEIATDSTDGATIYAASDRESARDALNQLCAVYHLYTARPGEDVDSGVRSVVGGEMEGRGVSALDLENEAGAEGGKVDGAVVETNFNPEDVPGEVRQEVRRRVGHRVRELRNAVEVLEERAHAE